jgi:regulator of protease activity HflC (stomatin/prohibitin superfamily)
MGALLILLFLGSLLGGIGYAIYASYQATKAQEEVAKNRSEEHLVVKPFGFLVGLVPALLFFSLYLGAYSVDAGSVGIVKRFGQPIRALQPGLHFVRPIGDTVTEVPVQTRIIKVAEAASSRDLQIVNTEVTLGYHVDPQHAVDILVQLNNDAENRVINPAVLESIKAEEAQYDVQQLITQRTQVRDGIEARIKARLAPYFIVAESTSITNFSFSAQYEAAIEAKQVAEQNAEKSKNVLEQTKVEATSAAVVAEGQANAKIANARGDGESQLIVARAKAEAQRLQVSNITPELLQLRAIELLHDKWDGTFPSTYMGSNGINPATLLIQPPAAHSTKTVNKSESAETAVRHAQGNE